MTTHYFLCHPHLELSYCQFSFRYLICAGTLSYMHFVLPGVLKLTIVSRFWRNIMTVKPSLQFLGHFGQNKAYLIFQIVNDFNSYDSYRPVNPAHTRCLLFKWHSSHILNVIWLFPMRKFQSTNGAKSDVRCHFMKPGRLHSFEWTKRCYESGIVQTHRWLSVTLKKLTARCLAHKIWKIVTF